LSRRYAEAAGEFEEAIRINPNLFDAYYYFARTSFAWGEIARSAELFGKAAEVRQEDFQSALLQGQSLSHARTGRRGPQRDARGHRARRARPGAEPCGRTGALPRFDRAVQRRPARACPGVVAPIARAPPGRPEH